MNQFKEVQSFIEKGTILNIQKEYDAALVVIDEGLSIYPDNRGLKMNKAWCFEMQGRNKEALTIYEELNETWILGWAYALTGEMEKAREVLVAQQKKAEKGESNAMSIAWTYLGMKDYDNTIVYFEKGMEQAIKGGWFGFHKYWFTHNDNFDVLKSNPRFLALLEKVNSYQGGG